MRSPREVLGGQIDNARRVAGWVVGNERRVSYGDGGLRGMRHEMIDWATKPVGWIGQLAALPAWAAKTAMYAPRAALGGLSAAAGYMQQGVSYVGERPVIGIGNWLRSSVKKALTVCTGGGEPKNAS